MENSLNQDLKGREFVIIDFYTGGLGAGLLVAIFEIFISGLFFSSLQIRFLISFVIGIVIGIVGFLISICGIIVASFGEILSSGRVVIKMIHAAIVVGNIEIVLRHAIITAHLIGVVTGIRIVTKHGVHLRVHSVDGIYGKRIGISSRFSVLIFNSRNVEHFQWIKSNPQLRHQTWWW